MPKIEFVHDPEIDKGGAGKRHTVKIDAVQRGGGMLSILIEQRRGSADRPLSREEVLAKFRRLASDALAPTAADEVIERVDALERQPDLARLMALITTRAA
jgi:2-methylcitrate dehydratase PrpD